MTKTKTMTIDGLTAGILGQAAERGGHDLTTVARAIGRAVASGYKIIETRKGRRYLWAEFTTVHSATDTRPVELLAEGDDFGSPSANVPLRGLPHFWGGVRRDVDGDEDRKLILGGIRLGSLADPQRMLLITPTQPLLALVGVTLPETVRNATEWCKLRDVVSSPALDGMDIVVKKWRDLSADEMRDVDRANAVPALGAKLKRLPSVTVNIG